MATSIALEASYDSFSKGNGIVEYIVFGLVSGATRTVTVKAAVTSQQIYFRGHISVSGATTILLKSGDAGTVIHTVVFATTGSAIIPLIHTEAGKLLQLHCSGDVTIKGIIATLPVASGQMVPENWQI